MKLLMLLNFKIWLMLIAICVGSLSRASDQVSTTQNSPTEQTEEEAVAEFMQKNPNLFKSASEKEDPCAKYELTQDESDVVLKRARSLSGKQSRTQAEEAELKDYSKAAAQYIEHATAPYRRCKGLE